MIKFYLKDGREHFKIETPYADVDTIADEAHKKSYPIEYSKFIKSLEPKQEQEKLPEAALEVIEEVVSGEIALEEAPIELKKTNRKKEKEITDGL